MTHPNTRAEDELELRREKIRSVLARGVRKPARILNMADIRPLYAPYKNPYSVIRHDIKVVKKQNEEMVKHGLQDGALGNYIDGLYEILVQAYSDYPDLEGQARVSMLKLIRETIQDIARAFGIDPDKIDPRALMVNIENKTDNYNSEIKLPDEVYDEFATMLARRISEDNKSASTS
ncbi:MAG: hypothetical protein QHH15_00305 [Candidatus Thermoplasmatota archaeon]|nr:hypothetical protein [Candidatus Thermoplasmatota archaeon]